MHVDACLRVGTVKSEWCQGEENAHESSIVVPLQQHDNEETIADGHGYPPLSVEAITDASSLHDKASPSPLFVVATFRLAQTFFCSRPKSTTLNKIHHAIST